MDRIHAAVARIHQPGVTNTSPLRADLGETVCSDLWAVAGAGFLVGSDLLVTCAHVLDRQPADVPVLVCFPQVPGCPRTWGRLVPGTWRDPDAEDVAFLRLETAPVGVPVLRLRSAPGPVGSLLRAFGFPGQAPLDGHPGTARVGRLFTANEVTLLGLDDANALAQGFSGSPLVDGDGLVVGMVTAHPGADRYGRGVNLAYATPAPTVLMQIRPDLQITLECPYPGLAPFTPDQARWYHGRTRIVDAVVDRLRTHRGVVAVLGPSGSGKSSLIAAGLLPTLAQGALPGITAGDVRVLRPGTTPDVIFEALHPAPGNTRLRLLVIDQFEELLTAGDPVASGDMDATALGGRSRRRPRES